MASAMCILDDFLEMKAKDNQGPFSRYTIDKIKRETEDVVEGKTDGRPIPMRPEVEGRSLKVLAPFNMRDLIEIFHRIGLD
ncbi:hypothetical protein Ddye_024657 [Dipteronia dyeriana]|uniref:Uncharacterized protein n=1 Tax=Dipteronia dyeriana TaxID=168575 RepID=A0AAD9TVA0_9ROSI|nr:hypothetical protein Ddye_024657 [Dipteronia dyeriana]